MGEPLLGLVPVGRRAGPIDIDEGVHSVNTLVMGRSLGVFGSP